MSGLRVDIWALDDDHTYLAPLPHVAGGTVSLIAGKSGGVEIKYPLTGLNASVLEERVTRRRDLPIAIRWDGTAQNALLARLFARDGSDVDETGIITYSGHLATQRLEEYELGPGPGENGTHVFPTATAGRIMREVLELAQADGALTDLHWTFTDTHDSNGVEWSQVTTAEIDPKNSVLAIADLLRQWGMAEVQVTSTLEVGLYEPETVGTDHTLANPPLVLRAGRDVVDATRRSDSRGAPTALLVEGAGGIYVEVTDPTAEALRGRRIVRSVSQGQLTTTGAATAYGQLELARTSIGLQEVQLGLGMHPDHPTPLRDLWPGDWVYRDTTRTLERERIVQLTIPLDADHPQGSVVLGDLIASHAEALQRQIDGLVGGQLVAGASTPDPDVDDGIPPAVPEGLLVESEAYPDGDAFFANVWADWTAVVEDASGATITDLAGYVVRWRYTDPALPAGWTVLPVVTDTEASWDGVVTGAGLEVQVVARDKWSRDSDWSPIVTHTAAEWSDPPPTPSTPTVTNYIGLLRTDLDGKGSAGEAMPRNLDVFEIHASTTNDFAVPDPPVAFADGGTLIGSLRGAGAFPWSPPGSLGAVDYDVTWYVKVVARDRQGNRSLASAQGSAIPGRIEQGDVATVNIGSLVAGILTALMTVSGVIETAPLGSRVRLDDTGFYCFDDDDNVIFSYEIDAQLMQMVGRLISGAGVGLGATITVDPGPPPRILLYPNATNLRYSITATAGTRPDGSTGALLELIALNTAGQPDGFCISAWSTNVWIGHRVPAGGWSGGIIKLQRVGGGLASIGADNGQVTVAEDGRIYISNGNALLDMNAGGNIELWRNGQLRLRTDPNGVVALPALFTDRIAGNASNAPRIGVHEGSDVWFWWTGGQLFIMNADTNSSIKTFVIDHPVDPDRWLVHACIEGPTADVIYRGEVEILDGRAVVELPRYFEAAARLDGRQVQLTPVDELCMVAASRIEAGRFTIRCSGPDGTRVQWLATAVRADAPLFDPEPLRTDVDVRGRGPYRWIATDARGEET